MLSTYVVSRLLSMRVIVHTLATSHATYLCSPSSSLKAGYHT